MKELFKKYVIKAIEEHPYFNTKKEVSLDKLCNYLKDKIHISLDQEQLEEMIIEKFCTLNMDFINRTIILNYDNVNSQREMLRQANQNVTSYNKEYTNSSSICSRCSENCYRPDRVACMNFKLRGCAATRSKARQRNYYNH